MLKRLFAITSILLLCVSWVTIRLPVAHDVYCAAALAEPLQDGHSVLVTRNPEESTLWKKELLRSAKHSIEFSTGFTGGQMLDESLAILSEVLDEQPDLVVHCFISECPLFANSDRVKVEEFAAKYPDRFHYLIRGMTALRHGVGFVTNENHVKALIVDEKYLVVGGTNFYRSGNNGEIPSNLKMSSLADYFFPKDFVDMDMVLSGPTVGQLRHEFFQLWALYETNASLKEDAQFFADDSRYFPIPEDGRAQLVALETHPRLVRNVSVKAHISGPRLYPGACSAAYAQLINDAEKSLDLMHMYMSPVDEVYDSLINASQRGLAINLVTNGGGTDTPMVTKAIGTYNRTHLLPLVLGSRFGIVERSRAETCIPGDCQIYTFDANETLYHKKVMVVDERISVIGSYNLGHKSHYGDHEVIVIMQSEDVAREFLATMQYDRSRAHLCQLSEIMDWHFGLGPRTLSLIEGTLIVGPLY